MKDHRYEVNVRWTGNKNGGTQNYSSYSRSHSIRVDGKYNEIHASSDPSFRGDPSKYNPEELFLSSISSCHMLWYLHLCSVHNIVVTKYTDKAIGTMRELKDGSGHFTEVVLHPSIKIKDKNHREKAFSLHRQANKMCFIANSCNFKIDHSPTIEIEETTDIM